MILYLLLTGDLPFRGNALEILKHVREKVQDINQRALPKGVRIVPHYDRTDLIDRTLHTVRKNMAEGILLVLVVLVAFLGMGNLGAAAIVALIIPLSLLGAFILLDARDVPANLISMGAVDFGIIVDPAVFVIENILRLLEERGNKAVITERLIETIAENASMNSAESLARITPLVSV